MRKAKLTSRVEALERRQPPRSTNDLSFLMDDDMVRLRELLEPFRRREVPKDVSSEANEIVRLARDLAGKRDVDDPPNSMTEAERVTALAERNARELTYQNARLAGAAHPPLDATAPAGA